MAIIYLRQSASAASVYDEPVNLDKLHGNGYRLERACPDVHVYYLTGPLFFGSVSTVMQIVGETHHQYRTLVLSMRGVPMVDVMGIHALEHLIHRQREHRGDVRLASLQPAVLRMLERAGLVDLLGKQNIYWSAVEAIVAAHNDHAASDCPHCNGLKPLALGLEPQLAPGAPSTA
jgi:sulfate permease, SulP family